MAASLSSNMRATTEAFLKSFDGQWTLEPTMALRAPDCQHTIFPTTYGAGTRNNEQFAEYFTRMAPRFSEAKMLIDDYIAVPNEHKTISRSTMDAMTPVGPFHNEYIWILTFDESGKKIRKIEEFFDTKAATEIRAKFREAGL